MTLVLILAIYILVFSTLAGVLQALLGIERQGPKLKWLLYDIYRDMLTIGMVTIMYYWWPL